MERFEGRVALVTGAGGGIGRACAARLDAEGATVVCADIDRDAASATATSLARRGVAVELDVTDPASCRDAVAAAVAAGGGRFDVLANVHGVGSFEATDDVALDEWRRVLDVNLTGVFLMCQAALDPLLASGRGAVVNMASLAGLKGTPYNAAYCASKGGVVMLTRALALEFAASGLRVNCVCPSAVDTAFLRNFAVPDGADISLFTRSAPVNGRMATPAEVAASVAFLASDDASMLTGVALPVDGGASA